MDRDSKLPSVLPSPSIFGSRLTEPWLPQPSYEKGIRESYILPMDNDKIDHFLFRLEEALTSDVSQLSSPSRIELLAS
jgi:hypothetical protein